MVVVSQVPRGRSTSVRQMGITTREILFAERPVGEPTPATFALATRELRDPAEGELLVRNRWMSVDPYMRGRMTTARSYVAGFELGKALQGGAIGEVLESRAEGVSAGDLVLHDLGWREHAVLKATYARKLTEAGMRTTSVRYNGTIHDFMMLNPLRPSAAVTAAVEQAVHVLRKALGTDENTENTEETKK